MKRTFAYGAAATQGAWPVQEDGYFADPSSGLFAVADGFGGRGAGDLAARLALQEARGLGADGSLAGPPALSPFERAHQRLFAEVHRKLTDWNEKRPVGSRGGTSLIVATVDRQRIATVTVYGACSAKLFRAGSWLAILLPQAALRLRADAPLLPVQGLGVGPLGPLESRSFPLLKGDVLLLGSGGVRWDACAPPLAESFSRSGEGEALREPLVEGLAQAAAPWNQSLVAVRALS